MLCEEIIAVCSEKYTQYILYVCSTGKHKSSTLLQFIVDLHVVTTGFWAVKFDNNDWEISV
jgi:hypothetical protein